MIGVSTYQAAMKLTAVDCMRAPNYWNGIGDGKGQFVA